MPLRIFNKNTKADISPDKKVRVSRAIIVDTTKDTYDQLRTETQSLNLKELVGIETNIADVETDQINKIVWANSKGYYAIYVALSRFLSKFCLNKEFREEVISNPSRFKIYLYEIEVKPENLFIFDEEGDRRVHPYPYSTDKTAHYLVQKGDIIVPSEMEAGPAILSPVTILEEFQRILFNTDPDLSIRIAQKLLLYAGRKDELGHLESALFKSLSPYESSPTCFTLINDFFLKSGLNPRVAEDIIARAISIHFVRLQMVPEFHHTPENYYGVWRQLAEEIRLTERVNDFNSTEMKKLQ